jgi:hypothetical protein
MKVNFPFAICLRIESKEGYKHNINKCLNVFQKYSLPEVLSGPFLMSDFEPTLITMILDKLQPDRMRFVLFKYCSVITYKSVMYYFYIVEK